jgi:hypothetical protein
MLLSVALTGINRMSPDLSALVGENSSMPKIKPVEAAFLSVLNRFQDTGFLSRFDEETITGALLGGLNSVFPFCVSIFGDDKIVERCCWGHFSKHESSLNPSEAQSGADFALVVYDTRNLARLALFQAKKVELDEGPNSLRKQSDRDKKHTNIEPYVQQKKITVISGLRPVSVAERRWLMDVHRRPKLPDSNNDVWREAQLLKLVEFGLEVLKHRSSCIDAIFARIYNLLKAAKYRPFGHKHSKRLKNMRRYLASKRRTVSFDSLDWLHYLAYASGSQRAAAQNETEKNKTATEIQEILCVPVCNLGEARWREMANSATQISRNWVDLSQVKCYRFIDVLREAVRKVVSPEDSSEGWLTVDNDVLGKILPDLMDLTTVYVADDKGGRSGLPLHIQKAIRHLNLDKIADLKVEAKATAGSTSIPKSSKSPFGI